MKDRIHERILTGPWERMKGLLGREGLPVGKVYVFPHCASIHTLGMRFAIDVVFLDRQNRILSFHPNVPPGRMLFGGRKASTTIEAQAGWLQLKIGEVWQGE